MGTTRAFLSTRNLLKVPNRGKALENWARPSIDELGVPSASHAEVHAANQQKFLLHLLGGLTFFGVTMWKVKYDERERQQHTASPPQVDNRLGLDSSSNC